MKKRLTALAIAQLALSQLTVAALPIAMDEQNTMNSEQLVMVLDDMTIQGAHETLSAKDYPVEILEEALVTARDLGRSMAAINIAQQLKLTQGTVTLPGTMIVQVSFTFLAPLSAEAQANFKKNFKSTDLKNILSKKRAKAKNDKANEEQQLHIHMPYTLISMAHHDDVQIRTIVNACMKACGNGKLSRLTNVGRKIPDTQKVRDFANSFKLFSND